MTVREFAERYRVRVRRDSCGDDIIPGKQRQKDSPARLESRCHVYDGFNGGLLGLCLTYPTKNRWTIAKRKLLAAGFVIKQNGDTEGCATFDPANEQQARLALLLAGVKTRRKASPAQQAVLVAARAARRLPAPIVGQAIFGPTNAECPGAGLR